MFDLLFVDILSGVYYFSLSLVFTQYATNNPVHDGSGHGGHGKLPTEEV
jgi:hypothetical protein